MGSLAVAPQSHAAHPVRVLIAPREVLHFELPAQFTHMQALPQAHCGPQAHAAFAPASWQPQVQSDPGQVSHAQVRSFASFIMGSDGFVEITERNLGVPYRASMNETAIRAVRWQVRFRTSF